MVQQGHPAYRYDFCPTFYTPKQRLVQRSSFLKSSLAKAKYGGSFQKPNFLYQPLFGYAFSEASLFGGTASKSLYQPLFCTMPRGPCRRWQRKNVNSRGTSAVATLKRLLSSFDEWPIVVQQTNPAYRYDFYPTFYTSQRRLVQETWFLKSSPAKAKYGGGFQKPNFLYQPVFGHAFSETSLFGGTAPKTLYQPVCCTMLCGTNRISRLEFADVLVKRSM